MVFQVKYEWEIKHFEGFSETKTSEILSPFFSASPDEICQRWKVALEWNSKFPEYYGIFLNLDDKPFQQPISAKFNYKVYNKENAIVANGQLSEYKYEKKGGWGHIKAINRSKCHFESIKRISFEIDLVRESKSSSSEKEGQEKSSTEIIGEKSSKTEQLSKLEPADHESAKILQEDLLKLYDGKEFSDLTIICGDRDFKVHKNILVTRSTHFKTIIENKNDDNIKLDDDIDREAFEVFLKFLYTGTIKMQPLLIDDILDISKRFQVEDLVNICQCEIVKNISISTAVKYLISADKHGMHDLKKNVLKFIKGNISVIMKTDTWKTFLVPRNDLMEAVLASIVCNGEE